VCASLQCPSDWRSFQIINAVETDGRLFMTKLETVEHLRCVGWGGAYKRFCILLPLHCTIREMVKT